MLKAHLAPPSIQRCPSSISLATLLTIVSIFLLLVVGYVAKRAGALKPGDAAVVNSIVVNLTMPAFIFVNTYQRPLTAGMVKAPALGFGMEMVVMALAYVAARLLRLDRRTTGALMLVSAFGNTGFLGYPVVQAAFGGGRHAMLTAVMMDEFAMAAALNTVGVAVATSFAGSRFEWASMLEFLKTPLFPATVVSLAVRNLYVPPVIVQTLTWLAAATVPLAMISIGLSLSGAAVWRRPGALAVALVLKMALLPVAMTLALPLTGVGGTVGKVAVLESAMPAAVFSGVIAGRFGANGPFAAAAIFVSTLLSVVAIPVVLGLLG